MTQGPARGNMIRRSLTVALLPGLVAATGWFPSSGCRRVEVRPAAPYTDDDSMALQIDCRPEDAEVRLDGVFQGTCGLLSRKNATLRLPAGTHELEVVADGYRPVRSRVSAQGFGQRLTVHLQRLPAP